MDRGKQLDNLIKRLCEAHYEERSFQAASRKDDVSNRENLVEVIIDLAENLSDFPEERDRFLDLAFRTLPHEHMSTIWTVIKIARLATPNGELEEKIFRYILDYYDARLKTKKCASCYNIDIKELLALMKKLGEK
jgi:hypothetical protein